MMDSPSSLDIPISNGDTPSVNLTLSLFRFIYFSIVRSSIMMFVFFACSTVAATIALPLILAAFVVTRFFQFVFACSYMFDKATKLKTLINLKLVLRTCLYLVTLYLMCVVVVLYSVASVRILDLNDIVLSGYPIKHWIMVYFIIFGIGTLSYFSSIISVRFVMFCVPLEYHTFKSGSHVVSDTVHEIIDCFILLFFAEQQIVHYFDFLKQYKILGFYPVHRLCHVLILLLVCHDLIGLSTHMFVWWLKKLISLRGNDTNHVRQKIGNKYLGRKSLVYWASGLKPSIMFTFTSLMLLLTWVFYFGHLINKHEHEFSDYSRVSDNNKVLKVGTWTTLCLFFFSILWAVKSCILLVLENNIVYKKFGSKILNQGKDLYFLGVLGRGRKDFLKLRYDVPSSTTSGSQGDEHKQLSKEPSEKSGFLYKIKKTFSFCEQISKDHVQAICTNDRGLSCFMLSIYPVFLTKAKARYQHPEEDPYDDNEHLGEQTRKKKLSQTKRKQVTEDLMKQEDHNTIMLYELQKMAHYFLGAKKAISKDKYTSHLLKHLQRGVTDNEAMKKTLKHLITNGSEQSETEWKDFKKSLDDEVVEPSQCSHRERSYAEKLETWLEEAHNRCMVLTYTLSSARKIVESLDRIMTVILVIITFIVWLLLTGLTSTDGIILVGSPIVSFSFIFGKACTTFFQGIVFVYVMHPFNVGDLCVIDNNMLEVIMIGVWKTTFSKVDTQEKVMYPNTDLMQKQIINHKTEFDWNDNIEIYVDANSMKASDLKTKIEKELKGAPEKYETNRGIIIDMEITAEYKVKIVVKLRYKPNLRRKSKNYFECFKEKLRRRTEFIQNIVDMDETRAISISEEPNFQVRIQ